MGELTKLAWKNERYFRRVEFLPRLRVCACTTAQVWRSEISLRAGTGSLLGIAFSSVAEAMLLPDGPHHQPCS